MYFEEIKMKPTTPRFTLTLSLEEAIDLYRLVSRAENEGSTSASSFVEALHNFAANSNRYTEYLPEKLLIEE